MAVSSGAGGVAVPSGTRARPQASELVSLAERMGTLGAVRAGFVAVVAAFGLLVPHLVQGSAQALILGSALYLLLLLSPWAIRHQPRRVAQWIVGGTLLVDGAYLAWVAFETGGTQSPLRILIVVDVVAVTLLASYRTGLKVAAWHSLLYFVVLYAEAAGILQVREALASALPGGAEFRTVSALQVGALWVAALATAGCSAVNERELRAQKVDLEELSALVRDLDRRTTATEVPGILLESLGRVFGFRRGVVLASPEGDLAVLARLGPVADLPVAAGLDRVVNRAWSERATQLVRALTPETDPRLASLFPEGRNLMVVPLLAQDGFRLGIVVLEHPAKDRYLKRWVVAMIEQFVAHAALTLHNAWLREELARQLEEIRGLERRLVAQNLELEVKVAERTEELSESLNDLRMVDGQRRRLLAHLVHAEEEERKRIAGDVHDDPVQKVVAVSMRIQLLRKALAQSEHREELDTILGAVRGCIYSLRHLIFQLRPDVLDREGLGSAIREFLESLDAEFGFRVDDGLESEPPAELRVVLYRMAQEALANVRKHAQADNVDVVLRHDEGGFLVRISDDGVGFSAPATLQSERGHLGLSSMRERAEMAGGRCRLHSLPGGGTTVEFWVPGRPAPPPEDAALPVALEQHATV